MKKIIALLLVTLMVAVMFVGCTSQPATSTAQTEQNAPATDAAATSGEEEISGKVTFVTFKSAFEEPLLAAVEEYERLYPNVDVTIEFETNDGLIMQRFAAGDDIGITYIPDNFGVTEANYAEYFVPLDDLGFTDENTRCLNAGRGDDGKLYLLTGGVNYYGMVYNKNVFKAAGVEVPTTMEEFWDVCEKIAAAGYIPLTTLYGTEAHCARNFVETDLYSYMGVANYTNSFVDQDAPFSVEYFTIPQIIREAIEKGYCEQNYLTATFSDYMQAMGNDKTGMAFSANWVFGTLENAGFEIDQLGMFPIPDSKALVLASDICYGITNKAAYPEACKHFLKWMFTDGNYYKMTGMASPFVEDTSVDPWIEEYISYVSPDQIISQEPDTSALNELENKAEFNQEAAAQAYIVAEDPQAYIDELNAKWAAAREALGY